MAGRTPRLTRRPTLSGLEPLESREVFAVGPPIPSLGPFLPPLGPFGNPGQVERIGAAGRDVNAHRALNRAISPVFGPQTGRVIRELEFGHELGRGLGADDQIFATSTARQVLSVPFIHQLFSREETFRLLRSEAVVTAYTRGAAQVLPSEIVVVSPPSIIGDIDDLQRVITITGGGGVGITVAVPSTIPVLELGNGQRLIRIPIELIPDAARSLLANQFGSSQTVFTSIGQDLFNGLRTAKPVEAPRAADNVPGLRLARVLGQTNPFPAALHRTPFARLLRSASAREIFDIDGRQNRLLNQRINQFYNTVRALFEGGAFDTPDPLPVQLPTRGETYEGTLQVSFGSLKEFFLDARGELDGRPKVSGLNLPGIEDQLGLGDSPDILGFPGRFDAGFVVDRDGFFGIYLSARDVANNVIPGQQRANKIFGEVAVEVSNGTSITDVAGLRNFEALSLGGGVSGSLLASSGNGIKTFSGSAGYGAGIEFGTGVRYTEIIPLGNLLTPRLR